MTTDTAGGVWSYSTALSETLARYGIRVVLAASGTNISRSQRKSIHLLERKGVKVHFKVLKLEWMDDASEDIDRASGWIRQLVKEERPDLIHFNNYGQVRLGWDIPTVLVAHSCVASWWLAVKKEPLPQRYASYFRIVEEAFAMADAVVSPTAAIQQTYQSLYGIRSNQLVIPNGIRKIAHPTLLPQKKSIFSAGRIWDEAKNISLLLAAASEIKSEIYIAGPASERYRPIKNVTFLGELSRRQVANWMRIATAYVMPVKYEPFGLSFLEAAAYSRPLIGGDIGTLREIWGEDMIYTDPEDKEELAARCNQLISDTSKTKELGIRAYRRSQHFTLEGMADRYHRLYTSLQRN